MISSLLLIVALSFDTFLVSMTYGLNDIRYSRYTMLILSGVGTLFLFSSLFFAQMIQSFIDERVAIMISGVLLLSLGTLSLAQSFIKSLLTKLKKQTICLKIKNLKLLLEIVDDGKKADIDASNTLSISESFLLSIALSMDSLASGFAYGLSVKPTLLLLIMNFVSCLGFVSFGSIIGRKMKNKITYNLSWLSGVFLILIALLKLKG